MGQLCGGGTELKQIKDSCRAERRQESRVEVNPGFSGLWISNGFFGEREGLSKGGARGFEGQQRGDEGLEGLRWGQGGVVKAEARHKSGGPLCEGHSRRRGGSRERQGVGGQRQLSWGNPSLGN